MYDELADFARTAIQSHFDEDDDDTDNEPNVEPETPSTRDTVLPVLVIANTSLGVKLAGSPSQATRAIMSHEIFP